VRLIVPSWHKVAGADGHEDQSADCPAAASAGRCSRGGHRLPVGALLASDSV